MLENTFNETPDAIETTRKNVFVINDVDLIIPPTSISVQKEDLTYSWKALRTKTTTKIPSGHGQIGVNVSCIFTHEQLLDLHRLIVQFRNSPYVYIENRYLRETIVPHWDITQNMAFVVNAVDVSPVNGTSNCLSMSLSLTWFNYFPYGNNFLFREDYLTDWVDYRNQAGPQAGFNQAMLSIGWIWQDGVQKHRPSIVYTRTSNGESLNRYDGTIEGSPRTAPKTVNELEQLHLGEEWDLLPLPDNMIPSRFVFRPSDSSIYTRYINLLQRDALLENFAIDVESSLGPAAKAFFHAIPKNADSKLMKTYGLHNGGEILDTEIRAAWLSSSAAWIREMISYHGNVTFRFQTYCSLDIPASLTDRTNKLKKSIVDEVLAETANKIVLDNGYKFLIRNKVDAENKTSFIDRQPIRDGLANPNGIVPFLGTEKGPMSWDEILKTVTSRVKIRSPKTNKKLYASGANAFSAYDDRIHYGMDFGVPHGTTILAPRDGIVTYIADENSGSALRWFTFNTVTQKSNYLSHSSWSDWTASIENVFDEVEVFSLNVKTVDPKTFPIGTFVQSLNDKNTYYYVGFGSGGRYLQLSHSSPSGVNDVSNYMHLFQILVKPGQTVKAGEAIAISGNSADFSKSYLNNKLSTLNFKSIDFATNPNAAYSVDKKISEIQDDVSSEIINPYSLGNHLHFEYWEDVNYAAPPNMDNNDTSDIYRLCKKVHPKKSSAKGGSRICTDIIRSIEIRDNPAGDTGPLRVSLIDDDSAETLVTEKIDELRDSGKLTAEQEEDITVMQKIFLDLIDDGWTYYDANSKISNVWFKTYNMTISRSLVAGLTQEIIDYHGGDSAILTGMSGGFRNIVPTVPIIGHEYPTSQFLGSTEPMYNLEISLLDQKGDLGGVSEAGSLLEGMRALLQNNARKFREVQDSWCVATDSFITRLFGSYKFDDYQVAVGTLSGDTSGVTSPDVTTHIQLFKRTVISRADNGTVEGHPGLSFMNMVLEETNPYIEEKIQSTAQTLVDAEKARGEILRAVQNFDFNIADFDSSKLTLALFFGLTGDQFTNVESDSFGKIELNDKNYIIDPETKSSLGTGVIFDPVQFGNTFTEQGLLFPPNPDIKRILSEAGVETQESPAFEGFFVPGSEVSDFFDPENTVYIPSVTRGVEVDNTVSGQRLREDNFRTPQNLDFSKLITSEEYLSLLNSDYTQLIEHYNLIDVVINSANRMIAEPEEIITKGKYYGKALTLNKVKGDLYDLNGVDPSKWRSWQAFMTTFCTNSSFVGRLFNAQALANAQVRQNPNWLHFSSNLGREEFLEIYNISPELWAGAWWYGVDFVDTLTTGFLEANYEFAKKSVHAVAWGANLHADAMVAIADFSPVGTESLTGVSATQTYKDLISSFKESVAINGVDYTYESRIDESVNELVQLYMRNQPMAKVWFRDLVKSYVDDTVLGAYLETFGEAGAENPFANVHKSLYNCMRSSGNWGFSAAGPPAFLYVEPPEGKDRQILFEEEDRFVTGQTRGYEWFMGKGQKVNTPFKWEVSEVEENAILQYHRRILANLADSIRRDPEALKLLGLEHLAMSSNRTVITGGEAYPDISLPFHPYFADKKSMSPDFYMWNVYQDGQALRREVLDDIYKVVESAVDRAYESMVEMQTGKNYNPQTDPYTNETVSIDQKIVFQAEGTDNNHSRVSEDDPAKVGGPMASPFYPTDETKEYETLFDNAMKDKGSAYVSTDKIKHLTGNEKNKPSPINVSYAEGPLGAGGGIQYPTRMSNDEYKSLKAKIGSTKRMFGASTGSLNENFNPDVKARLSGSGAEYVDQFAHMFDRTSLKKLARDSSKDMLSHKLSMKRAYPTFKLFFVEEDDFEDRIVAFDDFHTYNGVVDFSVVQSRKNPADHAMITLQNVGGSLDGTRRNAIADLDYIIDEDVKSPENDPVTRNTSSEQPFSAIVLRPGLNVQLRAGYSNDPDNLHVLINGRVIDVSWNDNGDLVKIMVQSFGTELAAITKGSPFNRGSGQKFASTHKLLSTLMLSPEVGHFGRWEIGQLFQEGEAKDARLDFTDYSRQGYMGWFKNATGLMTWLIDHPIVMFGAAGLGVALNFLPTTRVTGLASKSFMGKYMASIIPGARLAAKAAPFRNATARAAFATATRSADDATTIIAKNADNFNFGGELIDTAGTLFKDLPAARRATFLNAIKPFLDDTFNVLVDSGVPRAAARASRKDAARIVSTAVNSTESSVDDVVKALASARSHMTRKAVSSQWLPIPMQLTKNKAGQFNSPGIWEGLVFLGNNGKEILTNRKVDALKVAGSVFANTSRLLVDAAILGAVLATLNSLVLKPAYNKFKDLTGRFFTRASVSMMLSPQDDNLYPPHPKDYMITNHPGWFKSIIEYAVYTGVTIVAGDYEVAEDASRLLSGQTNLFEKRVAVEDAEYEILGSTIWDIFHEMTLRHPGWVYGARPYGNTFRYTMFFGIPSQRYWAKPASNTFISRANQLYRYLVDGKVTEEEYLSLYGNELGNGTIDDARNAYREEFKANYTFLVTGGYNETGNLSDLSEGMKIDPNLIEEAVKEELSIQMTGRAMQEYLRALNHRFIPFRRYHTISSDQDIVWNGVMNSENAMANAVEVPYFLSKDANTPGAAPYGTARFKAHWSVPDYLTRSVLMPAYPNCKGYAMAMRYGMGSLMYQMKEMYRGEILLTGNPRIRPWDICVVLDTYNDMIGPVEVEQVVHTFSYSTGFITEIKPSAVVIGNEISSYPLLVGVRLFSLAVIDATKNAEDFQYRAVSGLLNTNHQVSKKLAGYVFHDGEANFDFLEEKYRELFPDGASLENAFDGKNEEDLQNLQQYVNTATSVIGPGIAAAGTAASIGTGILASRLGKRFGIDPNVASKIIGRGTKTMAGTGLVAGITAQGLIDSVTPKHHLAFLLGGPVLFMQCLRNDAVMLIPLMKNGSPIVSGFNYNDPSMVWQDIAGQLSSYAGDVFSGADALFDLYSKYGSHAWSKLPEAFNGNVNLTGE